MTTCLWCGHTIEEQEGRWVDLEATGDDAIWAETCPEHDTFTAEHEPGKSPEPAWLPRWRELKNVYGLTYEQAFAVWSLMDRLHLFNYAWIADNSLKQLQVMYGAVEPDA